MSQVIPKGWAIAKISDVSAKCAQRKPELSETFSYVDIGSINRELKVIESPQLIQGDGAPSRARKVLNQGDILVSLTRPNLNAVALVSKKYDQQIASTGFEVIKPLVIESRYIFALSRTKHFIDSISGVVQGALYPAAKSSDVQAYQFSLPPLAEQKVIADKLDELLAQVESTKARLDAIPAILKSFRQSVLKAAVSGKLTEEWRGAYSPSLVDTQEIINELFEEGYTHGNFGRKLDRAPLITPDESNLVVKHQNGWELIRLGSLCESVVPNRDKPKKFSGSFHWLLTPHFNEQSIWIDYSKIENGLSEDEVKEYKAKVIKTGNVIMTCVGRVGLSAVLEEDSVINQQLHAFIVNDYVKPEYLAYCIRANINYFEVKATSTTVSYLNKTSCNSLPIPLPSIEEQTEIVRRVEELFAFADKVEAQVNAAQARVNHLTQSILAKAFRGELTKEWRTANPELISGENSAKALLERIKAERETLTTKSKPSKSRKKVIANEG